MLSNEYVGISKALETFVKQIRLNAGKIKIFERNIRGILREFLETVAPICAYNILAQNQFTYWKSLSEEDIQQILTSKDIEKFLSDKINDSSFVDYNNLGKIIVQSDLLSDANKSIFNEVLKAMEIKLYDLALVGVVCVFDGALSVATEDATTRISSRLDKIERRFEKLSDEEIVNMEESDMTILGMYLTWTESMKKFQAFSEFSNPETEPCNINRHWIMHGRKTSIATELDCCKMINALFGLIYFGTKERITIE